MYESELGVKTYQAWENFKLHANFDKSLQSEKYQSLAGGDAMLTWIEDHFEKTEFKSMDEAREMLKFKANLLKQLTRENIELYKYEQTVIRLCGNEILQDVWKELQMIYGSDRFMF